MLRDRKLPLLETSGHHNSNGPSAKKLPTTTQECAVVTTSDIDRSKLSPKTRVGDHMTRQTELTNTDERVDLFRRAIDTILSFLNFVVLRPRENAVAEKKSIPHYFYFVRIPHTFYFIGIPHNFYFSLWDHEPSWLQSHSAKGKNQLRKISEYPCARTRKRVPCGCSAKIRDTTENIRMVGSNPLFVREKRGDKDNQAKNTSFFFIHDRCARRGRMGGL